MCDECIYKLTCEQYDTYLAHCDNFAKDSDKIENNEFIAQKFCLKQ